MWGRLFLSAVVVVLIIVWLVAIYLMIVDPRTVLQKWQRGLWSTGEMEAVLTPSAEPTAFSAFGVKCEKPQNVCF
jgi:hypothetical protein